MQRSELQHDTKKKLFRIVTSRQKTGTHVSVPIPEDVAREVLAVLNGNPKYFFWTGTSKAQSAVTNWQHDLRELFRTTFGKTTDFTPHCLRDTFAVDLLQKGIPIEEVSKLLGLASIKTTEKNGKELQPVGQCEAGSLCQYLIKFHAGIIHTNTYHTQRQF